MGVGRDKDELTEEMSTLMTGMRSRHCHLLSTPPGPLLLLTDVSLEGKTISS